MPILPLIDLLILMGWTSLLVGFVQKAIWVTTHYRPGLLGLSPMDFVAISGICLVFALSLAARTWVKLNEPRLVTAQRHLAELEAQKRAREVAFGAGNGNGDELLPPQGAPISRHPDTAS